MPLASAQSYMSMNIYKCQQGEWHNLQLFENSRMENLKLLINILCENGYNDWIKDSGAKVA
jgi:hypothetical protein